MNKANDKYFVNPLKSLNRNCNKFLQVFNYVMYRWKFIAVKRYVSLWEVYIILPWIPVIKLYCSVNTRNYSQTQMNNPAFCHFDAFSFTNKTTNLKAQWPNLRQPLPPNLHVTERRKNKNIPYKFKTVGCNKTIFKNRIRINGLLQKNLTFGWRLLCFVFWFNCVTHNICYAY